MDISDSMDGATWPGSQQVSRVEWLKKGLFGIFHSMTETTSSSPHVKTRQQVWRVSLLAIDAMQVAVLALRLDYGWSARWFGWLQNMSLLGWLLPDVRPEWYNIVYAVVVLMVWVALIDAAYVFEAWGNARRRRTHSPGLLWCRSYVGYMFQHGNFTSTGIAALKLLRALVRILLTAGFVPIFGVLISPLDCAAMRGWVVWACAHLRNAALTGVVRLCRYNGEDFSCTSPHAVLFILISLATMLCFVPFGLAASLVFHDSDANSRSIVAKANGRESMYGVGAKIIAVSSSRLAGTLPALPPLLMVVMYGSLACYVSMGLPFYDNRMNRFRAGASTVTATMALGALILVLTGADAEIFTATWVVVGVLSTVFGSMLPVARRRQLLVRVPQRSRMQCCEG